MQKLNSKRSYSEMYEILNILGEDFINRIPKKMYKLIDEERDKDYIPNLLQENGLLDETKISQETIALFAVLNVKYFMDNENQKHEFLNILKANEEKYQAELREKYNSDNIFQNNSKPIIKQSQPVPQDKALAKVNQGFFAKFISKIKERFHLK